MRTLLTPYRIGLALLLGAVLTLTACSPPPPPEQSGELIVAVRNGPSTFFRSSAGKQAGFEHDLLEGFAASQGWEIDWDEERTPEALYDVLDRQRAHIAAAALPRSVVRSHQLIAGPTLFETPVHVVVRVNSGIRRVTQLKDRKVALIVGSGHTALLMKLKRLHPGLSWAALENVWPEELLAELDAGHYDAVVINGMDFGPLRTQYPGLQVAFDLQEKQSIVWALPRTSSMEMRNALSRYVEQARRDGTLAQTFERYFGHVERLANIDALGIFQRLPHRLPSLRSYFQEAQTLTGIDWRLLAAIGYQESQWNASATSPTGVRGLMMLTGETADRLGIKNRLDPRESIIGGARYLAMMRDALPDRIPEPDRTWIALAAYNQGQGHLEDARRIAQARGGSPDRWMDVKAALPYLSRGTYSRVTRYGYARGAEALIFAENIRNYYDILLRAEPAYDPLFQIGTSDDAPTGSPG